jgi:hypothetical protein
VRRLSAGHTALWTSVFDIDTFSSDEGRNVGVRRTEKGWKGDVRWTDKGQQAKNSKDDGRNREGFEHR